METELSKSFMELRKKAGVTQRQIANALDVRQGTVSDWETGKHMPRLSPSEMLVLTEMLKCSLTELAQAFQGEVHVN